MATKRGIRVALVGSDTIRGKEITVLLNKKKILIERIEFYDPGVENEFSKLTQFCGEPKVIHHLDEQSFEGIDLAFLAANPTTNRKFGPIAAKKKAWVIDLSGAFNADRTVPLVVAGVNEKILRRRSHGIIANPHPVTIFLSHLFRHMQQNFGLEESDAIVLQPVSAFDDSGIEELANQCFDVLRGSQITKRVFKTQIAYNLLSQTDRVNENGFSEIEEQVISELKRIFARDEIRLTLSLIQAPVFHTYSIMVRCILKNNVSISHLEESFKKSSYLKRVPSIASCPASSVSVAGKDQIYIGRIKKDESFPRSFWIWAVADNLTRGSAMNAFEIAEKVLSDL